MTRRGLLHHASVVNDHIYLAEAIERRLERLMPRVDLGNVACNWDNVAVKVGFCDFSGQVGVDVNDNDFRAFSSEFLCYSL
jgi:hypothetical protein